MATHVDRMDAMKTRKVLVGESLVRRPLAVPRSSKDIINTIIRRRFVWLKLAYDHM